MAVIRFRGGGLGCLMLSNAQKPALYCKIHIFGANGAAVGVQTDGGFMFIPGHSKIAEPPYNDLWTIPGDEQLPKKWKQEDEAFFSSVQATGYYHERQIQDFLEAILHGGKPLVDGLEGRKTVELFTAVYRSAQEGCPVRFPLAATAQRGNTE